MRRVRVIPVLLMDNGRLVKTVKFRKPRYVGDPINTIRIFNEKEVDEIVLLDISATKQGRPPDIERIREIAGECFMPLAYGGGIQNLDQMDSLVKAGVEKLVFNTALRESPKLISEGAKIYGSQSIVVSLDVRKHWLGHYQCRVSSGSIRLGLSLMQACQRIIELGAGEIILNNISREGASQGYDISLIHAVASDVPIPVVAVGGACSLENFYQCVEQGHASAVGAGSMFVFKGIHKAVLISYPDQQSLREKIFDRL